jgi:hypothetical protein
LQRGRYGTPAADAKTPAVLTSAPDISSMEMFVSFVFRLISTDGDAQDEDAASSIAFQDSIGPGYVSLWEEVGVYDALYNSDGREAREVSRAIAYGIDQLADDESLGRMLPATARVGEAIRFLENVHRGCTIHPSARIETR